MHDTIVAIIPARYGSTRFPGKALADIQGKPMIQWVYERTQKSKLVDQVIVATDDQRILDAVRSFGGTAVMTASDHATGTDRIAEVARGIECSLVVNVQGDEPLIAPEMIDEAVQPLLDADDLPMGTVCRRIDDQQELVDPNVVKVVFDKNNVALYFSRAPIPWDRDHWSGTRSLTELSMSSPAYKHIGLYVYRRNFLLTYAQLPQTFLEQVEKLEQLRALEHGCKIKVAVTRHESFGVDIPDDLGKIMRRLQESRV